MAEWIFSVLTRSGKRRPTNATGTDSERTPWHATQRAAWEALRKAEAGER